MEGHLSLRKVVGFRAITQMLNWNTKSGYRAFQEGFSAQERSGICAFLTMLIFVNTPLLFLLLLKQLFEVAVDDFDNRQHPAQDADRGTKIFIQELHAQVGEGIEQVELKGRVAMSGLRLSGNGRLAIL